jgi:hypothetical protein
MVLGANILGVAAIYFLGMKIRGRFLGALAAIMLSFNLMYFEMSSCILIDGFLAVFTIGFFYVLTWISQKEVTRQDFYLGFAVMALILLKWSGGMMLPFLFCYYFLAFPDLTFGERFRKVIVPFTFGAVMVGILLWHNYAILGNWLPKVFGASDGSYREPFFYYYDHFLGNTCVALFLPFFVFGLWMTLKSDDRNYWVHGLWVVFSFLIISAMPNKDLRFMLPIVPSIILVTAMGIDAVLSKIEKHRFLFFIKPLCLILIFGSFLFVEYPKIEKRMVEKSHGYTGFPAAGAYIKKEIARSPDTLVVASSPRMIRYFTDINFKEFGGNLSKIPENEAGFISMIQSSSSDIVLVLDIWEWAQPKWIYPLVDKHLKSFADLGFKLERVINRDVVVSAAGGLQKKAVVLIFYRPGKGL